jgi:hypothetical protein
MAMIGRRAVPVLLALSAWFAAAPPGTVARAAPPGVPDLSTSGSAPSLGQAQEAIVVAERAQAPAERAAGLASARAQLEAYIQKPASNDDVPTAQMLLGRVLILEGRDVIGRAEQAPADQREQLMVRAREQLRRGELAYSTAIEQLRGQWAGIPKFLAADDPNRAASDRIKESLLQSLMAHAGVAEELATTFPADTDPANEHFKAAAERYELIYKDYRTLIVGLMARLKQGECTFRLGDTRRALGLYDDILNQPANLEPLRRLRVAAMYLSLECWTTEREKLYELALTQGEEYLTQVRPEEETWPEWHAVRFHTARGYQLAAAGLGAGRAADRAKYLAKAKQHAEKLAETPGPYQEAARSLANPKP